MDFSYFSDDPTQAALLKSMEGYTNFLYSYGNVAVWNLLTTLQMIVPTAAYLESFKQTPVYLGDNSWQWSYTVGQGLQTLTVRLVTKRKSNEDFTAELLISSAGGEEFKWFDGVIRYDKTKADWTMYMDDQVAGAVAWLDVEWNMDWEKNISDLTYTILTGEEKDSYIEFGITEATDYNAYYTISFSAKDTYIKWNIDSKEGRVKDETNFTDSDWHCWNELFQDVECQ